MSEKVKEAIVTRLNELFTVVGKIFRSRYYQYTMNKSVISLTVGVGSANGIQTIHVCTTSTINYTNMVDKKAS